MPIEPAEMIAAVCAAERFFLTEGGEVRIVRRDEQPAAWEVFRGHLLGASQTRAQRQLTQFEVLFHWPGAIDAANQGDQPLLAFHWDRQARTLHVTRGILMYGWETYEPSPNVIESRETTIWRRELVGSVEWIDLAATDPAATLRLQQTLAGHVERAIYGSSRLPITSLESPLPSFSLGRLAYFSLPPARPAGKPLGRPAEILERILPLCRNANEIARVVEVTLRAAQSKDLGGLAHAFLRHAPGAADWPAVLRIFFAELALSPYEDLGERVAIWLDAWSSPDCLGPAAAVDAASQMLRHLARHLTAFDLMTFHNRGANYPDALFLDALLKLYLRFAERFPALFCERETTTAEVIPSGCEAVPVTAKFRLRRRALRQAWLLRRMYEGLAVPPDPTSPGENLRVLPENFVRASQDELLHPVKRKKKLFADDPLEEIFTTSAHGIWRQALADLAHPLESRELGMATFMDRPLGRDKAPGEVDRTPLLTYEAFSREIALERASQLRAWGVLPDDGLWQRLNQTLQEMPIEGRPVAEYTAAERPASVGLEEARKASGDFVLLRTTKRSLAEFLGHFDWRQVGATSADVAQWLTKGGNVLLVRPAQGPVGCLECWDGTHRRAVLTAARCDFLEIGGVELPKGGLELHTATGTTDHLPLTGGT